MNIKQLKKFYITTRTRYIHKVAAGCMELRIRDAVTAGRQTDEEDEQGGGDGGGDGDGAGDGNGDGADEGVGLNAGEFDQPPLGWRAVMRMFHRGMQGGEKEQGT